MSKRVNPIGSRDSKIVLLGEAPGATEEREGIPFIGTAGRVLDGILEETGIKREDCYITNVYKTRPPNNDITKITPLELNGAIAELWDEVMTLDPNVIVLLGSVALEAILELKGISNWRGSVLQNKHGVKCIPVYHPAAIARQWSYRPITVCDFKKVAIESKTPHLVRQERQLIVMPTYEEAVEWLNKISQSEYIAFDIEVETAQVSCVSLAISPTLSISIPFWFGSSGSFYSVEQEMHLWGLLKKILEDSAIKKIAQNAQYDMTILADKYDIVVSPLWLDTMVAFHSIYPELPKALAFLTSIYTDAPYYKFQRRTDDMTEFFRYNAMDSAVTYEVAFKIMKEMQEAGTVDFYYEHMHSLIEPLMNMSRKGVLLNTELKKKSIKEYKEELKNLSETLEKQVGHPLNPNSHKQMSEWLYDELKLPKQYMGFGKARRVTANAEALENLGKLYDIPALNTILRAREHKKILSTYLEVTYDKEEKVFLHEDETTQQIIETRRQVEERARTSYLITGTETGRLSSRESVYNTGTNLQNVPKGIARRIFIPDPGKLFINADLSQAEARVVAYLSGEDKLISIFSSGGDIHTKNAATIFRKKEEEVSKAERELAKRVVHASNYGMGPRTFGKQVGIPEKEAKVLLNQYFATYPRIKTWQMQIAYNLRGSRTLTTPLGRKRTFFNEWSDSLKKEALAYVPQSTVADILNMGLRRVYEEYKNTDTNLLLQIHDAILVQTPSEQVPEVASKIKELLSIPVEINHRTLVIPVDVSVGASWDDLVNYPTLEC